MPWRPCRGRRRRRAAGGGGARRRPRGSAAMGRMAATQARQRRGWSAGPTPVSIRAPPHSAGRRRLARRQGGGGSGSGDAARRRQGPASAGASGVWVCALDLEQGGGKRIWRTHATLDSDAFASRGGEVLRSVPSGNGHGRRSRRINCVQIRVFIASGRMANA